MTSAIARLNDFGQSPWYDNITRTLVRGGGLQQLIDEDGIRGVTSNPTIFDKAIGGGEGYDDQLLSLHKDGVGPEDAFWALAVDDIGNGADLLRPIYDRTDRSDGFISIEVSPLLAHDTAKTIEQAAALFKRLDRPNILIKIPATLEGIPAIEETIAAGINVNVTLIFSLDRHAAVIEAYLTGLERFAKAGGDLAGVSSVASFFVSRVDTETDKRLADDSPLRGKAAVANAKLAYALFREKFAGDRWDALGEAGREAAAAAVGVDVDEEPRLLPHALRRHAHRSRHREHARARVDRRAARGRHHDGGGHGGAGRRRRAAGHEGPGGCGRRLRRRDRDAGARGRRLVRAVLQGPHRHPREAHRRDRGLAPASASPGTPAPGRRRGRPGCPARCCRRAGGGPTTRSGSRAASAHRRAG